MMYRETILLSFDPGTRKTGYAVFCNELLVEFCEKNISYEDKTL